MRDYLYIYTPEGTTPIDSASDAEKHRAALHTYGEHAYHLETVGLEGAALFEALERVRNSDDPVTGLVTEIVQKYMGKTRVVSAPVPSTFDGWVLGHFAEALGLGQKEIPRDWAKVVLEGVKEYNPFLTGFGEDLMRVLGEYTITIDGVEYIIPDMWEF